MGDGGGGGVTAYDGPYGEVPPERAFQASGI